MRCREARNRLFAPAATAVDDELRAHLDGCPGCAALAARLAAFQQGARAHRVELVPDPAFSARVVAALPGNTELLGWAALRLLPAALALALAFSWYTASLGPGPADLLLHPDDPTVLTYVAFGPEAGS